MATPAEAAVIAAVRAMRAADLKQEDLGGPCDELFEALEALDAPPATGEVAITWGQVVAGDGVQNVNTKAWHEVLENNVRAGQAHVRLKDVAKLIVKPAATELTVRRSEMGQAVDVFAAVIWSGPNGRAE